MMDLRLAPLEQKRANEGSKPIKRSFAPQRWENCIKLLNEKKMESFANLLLLNESIRKE